MENDQYWIDKAQEWMQIEDWQISDEDKMSAIREISILKPKSILDVGCGTGRWSKWLKCENYLGVDISPVLIDEAERKYPHSNFKVCRAKDIIGDFDLIFTFVVLSNFNPLEMEEISQVFKRVGKYGLFIEPGVEGNQGPNPKIYLHDFKKYFDVIKTYPFKTSRDLTLVKLCNTK